MNGGGYGQSGQSYGSGSGGGKPDTQMLMQQIQELKKTVMQLQANQSMAGGGGMAQSGVGGDFSGFGGGNNSNAWGSFGGGNSGGYGFGSSGFGGSSYGPNSGFGGGYSTHSTVYKTGGGGGNPGIGPKRPSQPRSEKQSKEDMEDVPSTEQRVVLVSNIPIQMSHPDCLYNMFEKFGVVERIKILHNKRNTALIQMSDPGEARRAVNEQTVLNRDWTDIFVSFSNRFKEVLLPQAGSVHDDGLTKDYTGQHTNLRTMPKDDRPMTQNNFGGGMDGMYGGMGGGMGGYGGGMMGGMGIGLGMSTGMNMGAAMGDGMDMGRGQNNVVLLVSNIPDEVADCDKIFNMLGAYGDVVCVKILRNKRDCALVQMAKPHHAQQVRNNLDQAKIGGNKLCISNSRVDNLLNKKLIEDEGLQRDYSNSRQHRFRNHTQAAKLQRNLGPPTSVLHVANIPDGYSHIDIKEMFIERGFTVKDSKDCDGKSHMCYLFFGGPDEALMALAAMHNYAPDDLKFKNSNGLCVSFSKAVKKD